MMHFNYCSFLSSLCFISLFIGCLLRCGPYRPTVRVNAETGYMLTYRCNKGDILHYSSTRQGMNSSERRGRSIENNCGRNKRILRPDEHNQPLYKRIEFGVKTHKNKKIIFGILMSGSKIGNHEVTERKERLSIFVNHFKQ